LAKRGSRTDGLLAQTLSRVKGLGRSWLCDVDIGFPAWGQGSHQTTVSGKTVTCCRYRTGLALPQLSQLSSLEGDNNLSPGALESTQRLRGWTDPELFRRPKPLRVFRSPRFQMNSWIAKRAATLILRKYVRRIETNRVFDRPLCVRTGLWRSKSRDSKAAAVYCKSFYKQSRCRAVR